MRELSLFTGAGGGLLGTHLLGWTPVGYVEWNNYCQRVIAARIRDGYLPVAPIFTDVREFVQSGAAEQYRGIADVVSAGFPCQPFSLAGRQAGADDERNMWPATRDVIRIVRPPFVWLENVPGLLVCGYVGTVLADLAEVGYVGSYGVLGGGHVGASMDGKRLWILATPDHARCEGTERQGEPNQARQERESARCQPLRPACGFWPAGPSEVSRVPRSPDGVAHRVDRLKALGNGQVPAVVARAWELLT
jgi:DNA (cytosine-5)-methyltransferase 1